MAGTLTITNPATDQAPGNATTSQAIAWSFSGTSGAVQTKYRVLVTKASIGGTVSDTGTLTSTATGYTVTGMVSGVYYDVAVTVTDSAAGTTTAHRIIVAKYSRPLPPVVSLTQNSDDAVVVTISNPNTGTARPQPTGNTVYRRQTGSGDDWSMLGTTGASGTFIDATAGSGCSYDYFARSDVGSDSLIATITTGAILGTRLYDVGDYGGTSRSFPYTVVKEGIGYQEAALWFAGRTSPVFEYGEQETRTFALTGTIPFSDPDHRAQADWWRARKAARAMLFLRTSRGIAEYVTITGDLTLDQARNGYAVTATFQKVYSAAQSTIPASSYNYVSTDDGGYGDGGYGQNGYGA